jgi:signal transduction histidine kinase
MAAAFFIFDLVAGMSDDMARQGSDDPARMELARMIAKDRTVAAAARAFVFLLAQAGIQVLALVISSMVATRGLNAEFRRMGELIAEQERRLEEAAALSGWKEVASFLSHQLKNPLAAVDLSASNAAMALERACPVQASDQAARSILEEALASIQEETGRMKALIARLKSLTAFERAVFQEDSLAAVAAQAAAKYPDSRARILVEGDARARMDRELLVQALVNVLDNCVEQAERALSLPVEISIRVTQGSGRCGFAIADDNSGLDAATAAKLGRERFTTKRTGSGLGLLFSSRIMAIHGGGFRAQAGPGGNLVAELDMESGMGTGGSA